MQTLKAIIIAVSLTLTVNLYQLKVDSPLIIQAGNLTFSFSYPEVDSYMKTLYLKNQKEIVDGICQKAEIPYLNSQLLFDKESQTFTITKEKCGKAINKVKLNNDIYQVLSVGGGRVKAEYVTTAPKITYAENIKYTNLKAKFTTYFVSNKEREENIMLAAKMLDGVKIDNGNTFSFNETVGERTEKRGFKNAKIIMNGEFVLGVGGGVCQASTTLYNSALLAGLKIKEQHAHSLKVGYIESSFDAMVSSAADLKIENNSGGVIHLSSKVNNNSITISIFGSKNYYEYKRVSIITEKIIPETKIVLCDYLPKGESNVIVEAKAGAKSIGELHLYKNGELVSKEVIRNDVYGSVDGLIEVGK